MTQYKPLPSNRLTLAKKILFAILVVVFLFTIVFMFYLETHKHMPSSNTPTSPTPTPFSSTPLSPFTPPSPLPSTLELMSVVPQTNTSQNLGGTNTSIVLFFSHPINPSTVKTTSFPNLKIKPLVYPNHPNQLVLQVNQEWFADADYTITISPGVSSTTNLTYDQPIVLNYHITQTPIPLNPIPGPDY